jgi:hypothetical protein
MAGAVVPAASAEAAFSGCQSIDDAMKRLACYDAAAKASAPSAKTPVAFSPVPAKPAARAPRRVWSGPASWYEIEAGPYQFFRNVPVKSPDVSPTQGPFPVPTSPGFIGLFSTTTATNTLPTAPSGFGGGGSYRTGYWLNPQRTTAFEWGAFFAMGHSRAPAPVNLTKTQFINTTPDVFVGLFTDSTTAMTSGTTDLLYGVDANVRMTVPSFPYFTKAEVIAGVRYIGLDELNSASSTYFTRNYATALGLPAPANLPLVNVAAGPNFYRVFNNFVGPQMGAAIEQHWGPYWAKAENTIAVGATIETIWTGPTTLGTTPTTDLALAGIPLMVNAGLPPSSGTLSGSLRWKGAFTVVPSGQLKIGYDIIPEQRSLTLAYNYLYMAAVGMVQEQYSWPVSTKQASFFAQGITLGYKERF